MGSTITTRRLASALGTNNGKVLYVLYEQTYESNVSPQVPSWGCIGLGYLPAAMKRIFGYASSCEGRMLKNPGGLLTPEGYLGTWMRQIAAPAPQTRTEVMLHSGTSYRAAMTQEAVPVAAGLLAGLGRQDLADTLLASKSLKLDLARDTDIILTLCTELKISPWTFVEDWMRPREDAGRDASLGYRPRAVRSTPPRLPRVMRHGEFDNCLAQAPDGAWRSAGQAYSIVGDHVASLWEQELATPGCYRASIKAVRSAYKVSSDTRNWTVPTRRTGQLRQTVSLLASVLLRLSSPERRFSRSR